MGHSEVKVNKNGTTFLVDISGGKTTLIDALMKDMINRVAIVPEAASILYRGGFPRRKNELRLRYAQRAIFFTQRELENLIQDENPSRTIICDRGSLDSLAYWPGDHNSFLMDVETTLDAEIRRYDWVIHLDTAPPEYYDSENPIRVESYQEAAELNAKTREAWKDHPRRIIISNQNDFLSKMMTCIGIVRKIDQDASFEELQKYILSTTK